MGEVAGSCQTLYPVVSLRYTTLEFVYGLLYTVNATMCKCILSPAGSRADIRRLLHPTFALTSFSPSRKIESSHSISIQYAVSTSTTSIIISVSSHARVRASWHNTTQETLSSSAHLQVRCDWTSRHRCGHHPVYLRPRYLRILTSTNNGTDRPPCSRVAKRTHRAPRGPNMALRCITQLGVGSLCGAWRNRAGVACMVCSKTAMRSAKRTVCFSLSMSDVRYPLLRSEGWFV